MLRKVVSHFHSFSWNMYSILVSFGDTNDSILLLQMFRIIIHDLYPVLLNFNKFTLTKEMCLGRWTHDWRKKSLYNDASPKYMFSNDLLRGQGWESFQSAKENREMMDWHNMELCLLGRTVWPGALWNHLWPCFCPQCSPEFHVRTA